MTPELKAKWIEALRSGEYKQTKDYLHTAEGYCCLGVLCEVWNEGRWEPGALNDVYRFAYEDDKFAGFLNDAVCDALGLDSAQMRTLADMNDRKDKLFAEIAAYIEEKL